MVALILCARASAQGYMRKQADDARSSFPFLAHRELVAVCEFIETADEHQGDITRSAAFLRADSRSPVPRNPLPKFVPSARDLVRPALGEGQQIVERTVVGAQRQLPRAPLLDRVATDLKVTRQSRLPIIAVIEDATDVREDIGRGLVFRPSRHCGPPSEPG